MLPDESESRRLIEVPSGLLRPARECLKLSVRQAAAITPCPLAGHAWEWEWRRWERSNHPRQVPRLVAVLTALGLAVDARRNGDLRDVEVLICHGPSRLCRSPVDIFSDQICNLATQHRSMIGDSVAMIRQVRTLLAERDDARAILLVLDGFESELSKVTHSS
ncbi:MAG TPA: hypothetical protein VJ851_09215 [Jatrophihabitans sp.]|nr:hypothetical protein [Jatrophihabitans sp.]